MDSDFPIGLPTAPSPSDLEQDVWDDDNRLCYSADGKRLLDAENFPSEVTVKEGCEIICDDVFAFQDYMAERNIGEPIPLEERNSFLEKIKLPSTLKHIGKGAFAECGELLTIKLPAGLESIGPFAFVDCWQLEKITFPASLKAIGEGAFQGCINLYQIRLGRNISYIGADAFDDCESLETIIVPHGMLDRFLSLLPKNLHKYIEEL